MYLAPFAGIMFLWFIAVVRDQIAQREDRFFATVFFGSGLLFVALLFAAAAVAPDPSSLASATSTCRPRRPARRGGDSGRWSYTLLFAFSTRAAAVFLISMVPPSASAAAPSRVGWLPPCMPTRRGGSRSCWSWRSSATGSS